MDDTLIFGSLEAMGRAEDLSVSEMAKRLHCRNLYKTLDLAEVGVDKGKQVQKQRHISSQFADKIVAGTVLLDNSASISIYSEIGGDEDRMHKKLHVLDDSKPVEIRKLSRLIGALEGKIQFTRFYFESEVDRDTARGKKGKNND